MMRWSFSRWSDQIDFKKLLRAALRNNPFRLDKEMLKQINVVAIRYPLVPTLANAFLCSHEQIWLNEYPGYLKLLYDRKYIHDIFVWFGSPDHLEKYKN